MEAEVWLACWKTLFSGQEQKPPPSADGGSGPNVSAVIMTANSAQTPIQPWSQLAFAEEMLGGRGAGRGGGQHCRSPEIQALITVHFGLPDPFSSDSCAQLLLVTESTATLRGESVLDCGEKWGIELALQEPCLLNMSWWLPFFPSYVTCCSEHSYCLENPCFWFTLDSSFWQKSFNFVCFVSLDLCFQEEYDYFWPHPALFLVYS